MNEIPVQWAFAAFFLAATCLAYRITPHLIFLSRRLGWMDIPKGRKAHPTSTPLLGGAALFISFWLTVVIGFLSGVTLRTGGTVGESTAAAIDGALMLSPELFALFCGSAVIWVIGALDDRFDLSPVVKLAGQAAACAILMTGTGLRIDLAASFGIFADAL